MSPPDTSQSNLKLPELKPDQAVVEQTRVFATGLVIKTAEGYERAAQQLLDIKKEIVRIEGEKDSVFKPINAGLRAFSAMVAKALNPLRDYEHSIKVAMIKYSDEQDRLRREQQRKDNERAEAERKRLEAAAERNRAKGNEAKAESFAERAQLVVAPVAQQKAPAVSGISIPQVWVGEVTDASLLPREYLIPDHVKINKQVAALKGDTNIPGVTVRQVKRIAAGRGA